MAKQASNAAAAKQQKGVFLHHAGTVARQTFLARVSRL
jgi:hypothetical protein